jgi:sphingolipid delta-4 desaturase
MSNSEFYWSATDEPHATRRKEILAKYPEIRELYGHDPSSKYFALFCCAFQFAACIALRNAPMWLVALLAWAFGGFASHSLFLAMHEIAHNLFFEKVVHNKLFGCLANTATAIPHFSMFQRYHMEHHQYQGVNGMDVDVPSAIEARFFSNRVMKLLFVFFQPLAYVIRPLIIRPKSPGRWEAINWSMCLAVDAALIYFFGYKTVAYLALSGLLGSGLHPMAGHFIAEHYVFNPGQETYSYYGPLNWLTYNVGFHNEHHDFPRIPGSRLPAVKKIAGEYYDLPHYSSWTKVLWDFVMDPKVSLFSRMKRRDTRLKKEE